MINEDLKILFISALFQIKICNVDARSLLSSVFIFTLMINIHTSKVLRSCL